MVLEGLVPKDKTILTNSTTWYILSIVVVIEYYVVQDSIEGWFFEIYIVHKYQYVIRKSS